MRSTVARCMAASLVITRFSLCYAHAAQGKARAAAVTSIDWKLTSVEWRHITDYEGPCTHAGVTPWRRQTWLAKLAADRLTCLAYDVP